MIIYLKTVEEFNILIKKSKALVLDFYANWCKPCVNLGKYLESVKDREEFRDVVFAKLDVDIADFENTCSEYGVTGLPHVVFFKNSVKYNTVTGFKEAEILDNLMKIAK